jgi:hypothetical protein
MRVTAQRPTPRAGAPHRWGQGGGPPGCGVPAAESGGRPPSHAARQERRAAFHDKACACATPADDSPPEDLTRPELTRNRPGGRAGPANPMHSSIHAVLARTPAKERQNGHGSRTDPARPGLARTGTDRPAGRPEPAESACGRPGLAAPPGAARRVTAERCAFILAHTHPPPPAAPVSSPHGCAARRGVDPAGPSRLACRASEHGHACHPAGRRPQPAFPGIPTRRPAGLLPSAPGCGPPPIRLPRPGPSPRPRSPSPHRPVALRMTYLTKILPRFSLEFT